MSVSGGTQTKKLWLAGGAPLIDYCIILTRRRDRLGIYSREGMTSSDTLCIYFIIIILI